MTPPAADPDGVVRARASAVISWQRDPVLLAVAAAGAAVVPALGAGWIDGSARLWLYWLAVTVLNAAWLAVIHPIGADPRIPAVTRRFWRSARVAGVLFVLGDLSQLASLPGSAGSAAAVSGGPVHLACMSAGCGVVVVAMLTTPLGLDTRRAQVRFWLDTATVLVAVAVCGGLLTGSFAAAGEPPAVTAVRLLAGAGTFVLAAFATLKLMLTGTVAFTRAAGVLGLLSVAGGAVLVLIRDEPARAGWAMAVYVTDMLLLLAAGRVQQRQVSADPGLLRNRRPRTYSLLPYTAVVAVYGLLAAVMVQDGLDARTWLMFCGAAVSTGMVVLRQVLAFADNERLLAELRHSQDELRHALRDREALTDRLRVMAHYDSLTGLANRALFLERLDAALPGAATVMLVDLDGFKAVNDRHGHAAGDALLREVGARLRAAVRPGDTVARLGGDEFGVLLCDTSEADATALADRLVSAARRPVTIADRPVRVGASIGLATSNGAGQEPDELLAAADAAMYAVKRSGKGTFRLAPAG